MRNRWLSSPASSLLSLPPNPSLVLGLFVLVTTCIGVNAQPAAQTAAAAGASSPALPATGQTGTGLSSNAGSPSHSPPANPPARPCNSSVLWDGTSLQVETTNCDLNTILQQVAVKTGTTLSGTAPGERIFGRYGPGTLDAVLSSLLEGVPVNVLLVNRNGNDRKELVLTARGGPPSPPSPSPRDDASANAANTRPAGAYGASRSEFNAAQQLPQLQPVQGPGGNTPLPGQAALPAPSDGTQPASPNGVKTPQEIFEQLQRLRSQQTQ